MTFTKYWQLAQRSIGLTPSSGEKGLAATGAGDCKRANSKLENGRRVRINRMGSLTYPEVSKSPMSVISTHRRRLFSVRYLSLSRIDRQWLAKIFGRNEKTARTDHPHEPPAPGIHHCMIAKS